MYILLIDGNLANLLFDLDHDLRVFQYMEAFAYDIYFTTIVYQVSRKLLEIKKSSPHYKAIWVAVHCLLIFFLLFLLVTLIVRLALQYYDCEEVWFLIINMFGILMSILMVVAGKLHEKFQQEKVQGITEKNIKSPMRDVWIWIIINICCQFARFLRSFIYIVSPLSCKFTDNYTANHWIGLIFELVSFHVGMIASIVFFRKKYREEQSDYSSSMFTSSIRDGLASNGESNAQQIQLSTSKPSENKNDAAQARETDPRNTEELTEQHRITVRSFIYNSYFQRENSDQHNPRITLSKAQNNNFSL